MNRTVLAAIIACLHALPSTLAFAGASAEALQLQRVIGGQVDDMVVAAPYAYVATGRVLVTWSYADANAPVQVSAVQKPAGGRLTGLVKHGKYLYGVWQTSYYTNGVAVYSLADPARPKLVNEVDVNTVFSRIHEIAVANDHLFLFDAENGIVVGSLHNRKKPRFRTASVGAGVEYKQAFTDGHWIHAFGKNFFGDAVLTSFDVSTPSAPREALPFYADGLDFSSWSYHSPFATGFGSKLGILDLSDPNQPILRGSVSGSRSTPTGIADSEYAYGVAFDGIDVWKIRDPDNPVPVARFDTDTLATAATASVPGGALLVTGTDRFVHLDTSDPAAPRESSALMRGSIAANDAALVGDTVLLLQQNYGLAIAEAATLDVVGRYEFDLPRNPQARAFYDMQVDGKLAYLAAWGYGLFIADVSNPRAPVEVARERFPAAHTVAVANNYAYLGKNLNGPELGIIDVSDPAQPNFLLSYSLPYSPNQLKAHGNHLYVAANALAGELQPAGLRILDVSNPYWVREVAHYDQGCDSAFNVAFADEAPIAYVACGNGLHVLDVSSPDRPMRVGYLPTREAGDLSISVEVRGNRAWYGSGAGVYEADITNSKFPRQVGFTAMGGFGPVNLRAIGRDRVLAMTGMAGIHVFGKAAPRSSSIQHPPVSVR